jgi:hypothetical protein
MAGHGLTRADRTNVQASRTIAGVASAGVVGTMISTS